ncbi:MAG: DUF2306 domain-containing protein [Gemmatimonadaceae bacterium]|nr:DUF2306 domain-containing protein [Gemmatimonadaceae bacterium]
MSARGFAPWRPGWRAPTLLIALSLVPTFAGVWRLAALATGSAGYSDTARFHAAPAPVVLHILAAIPYSIFGAFQFAPALRRHKWHRIAGRVLGACGLVVALSGLWMAQFYPWPAGDGVGVYVERLLAGTGMLTFLALGVRAAAQMKFPAHGAWMTRAYALGMGAATQVLTHLPYVLLIGTPDETWRAVLMGAGWVINLFVAEWSIWSDRRATRGPLPQVVVAGGIS